MLTLLIFALCDYSITNRLPQPDPTFGPCPQLYIMAECYLQVEDVNQHRYQADVNKDNTVNLIDLAIYAEHFSGGFYKPKPEPKQVEIPIEIKAIILKLLMEN